MSETREPATKRQLDHSMILADMSVTSLLHSSFSSLSCRQSVKHAERLDGEDNGPFITTEDRRKLLLRAILTDALQMVEDTTATEERMLLPNESQ
jgi:hypothetical protein